MTTKRSGKRAAAAGRGEPRTRGSGAPRVAKSAPLESAPLELKSAASAAPKRQSSLASTSAQLRRQLNAAKLQQEASAEVLRAVANAAGDAARPLQLIAETTARLFGAASASIQLAEGSEFTQEYRVGGIAQRIGSAYPRSNIKVGGRNLPGTVVAECRQIHIPDLDRLDPSMSDFPGLPHARAGGARTVCGTPLRREGKAIGALIVFRDRLRPFADDELALLQSFADQAVIAIENARLFEEVQAKTRAVEEALQQQTATADVLRIISRSVAHAAPVFDTILESCHRLFSPYDAAVYLVEGDAVRGVARRGPGAGDWGADSMPLEGSSTGAAIAQRGPVHFPDLADKPDLPEDKRMTLKDTGGMTVLYAPMISQDRGVGSLVVTRRPRKPFTQSEIALIQTFADQAVIAIENVRLFDEVQAKTSELAARNDAFREQIEHQSATIDVLKTMSASPRDPQPVFDLIVEQAEAVCGADAASLLEFDGEQVHLRSVRGRDHVAVNAYRASFPRPVSRDSVVSRAMLEARIVHLTNAVNDAELSPQARAIAGNASLGVPITRDGVVIGGIGMTTATPNGFSEGQVALLVTFAEQAAIAIASAGTFRTLQQRTSELSSSLDELRSAQDRLVQTEKLASLGQLTAGIAHEIKNPLNFVNNFSALSVELTAELNDVLEQAQLAKQLRDDVDELTGLLRDNLSKIVQHGKRADSIVKNMLLHSRDGAGERRLADINALVGESLNLAYHGARAEKPDFTIMLREDLDPKAGALDLYPQEITRALLNLISNGFYAAARRKAEVDDISFEPVLSATTKDRGKTVEIRIRDNGTGISPEVKAKIFNPFFTTKPTGEGTGLGLSMTHDIIVKQHGGTIDFDTEPGAFTEFIITLPRGDGAIGDETPE